MATEFSEATQHPIAPQRPPRSAGLQALGLAIEIVVIFVLAVIAAALVAGLWVALQMIRQGGTAALQGQGQAAALRLLGPYGITLSLLVQNLVMGLLPMLRVWLVSHQPLSTIGFQAQRPLRLIGLGLLLGVAVLFGNALIGLGFKTLGVEQNQAAQYPLYTGDYAGQAVFLVGAALLAPIGEEILFRGYIFNRVRQIFAGRSWGVPLAYFVSALLFSLAHILSATEGVIALLVPTLLMGLALAWAMHRTGSLIPSIIAHALNNGVALLGLLACVNLPGTPGCPS